MAASMVTLVKWIGAAHGCIPILQAPTMDCFSDGAGCAAKNLLADVGTR